MNSYDVASVQTEEATRTPFPPIQRVNVFLAEEAQAITDVLRRQWFRWGGETDFVFPNGSEERILNCGIAIFQRDSCEHPNAVWELLSRGRDVFEYCPVRQNFRRIDEETFRLFYWYH